MRKDAYKVFDKKGTFIKNVNVGLRCKYKTQEEFEAFLKENGLYAHRQESFEGRPYWRGWTFKQKLENLGWKFGKRGNLIGTEW